jgi:hypothetical protein
MERDVDRLAAVEGNGGQVLVKEGLEHDDLVALLEEGDKD